jgi:hypothetical protein
VTSYLLRYDQSFIALSGDSLYLQAGIYEVRIAQVTLWCSTVNAAELYTAYRYEGGSASGGTSMPVIALRQGAPAASATAGGGAVSYTGTQRAINATVLPPGAVSTTIGTTPTQTHPGSTAQMQFPLPTIIAPGSFFSVTGDFSGPGTGLEMYFEELRLKGSY